VPWLVGFLAVAGLMMVLAPTGFGRLARELRGIPGPTAATEKISRAMGIVVLAAAVVVLIAWG